VPVFVLVRTVMIHAWAIALVAIAAAAEPAEVTADDTGAVHTIVDALSLPTDVRDRGAVARVRAVVTMWQPDEDIGVIQDATAAIWMACGDPATKDRTRGVIRPGMDVVVSGSLYRGGYSPLLLVNSIEFLQEVDLPTPKPADLERVFVGADNGLRIDCEGIVQGCQRGAVQSSLAVACGARRMSVQVLDANGLPPPETLVDARVRITGVVGSVRNTRGEFLAPRLVANSADDIAVLEPAPASPADVPTIPLAEIGRYRFDPVTSRRIATEGIVTYAAPDVIFIQQGVRGVRVAPTATTSWNVTPGDRVKVTGFIDTVRRIAGIREATVELLSRGAAPKPTLLSPAAILRVNTTAMARHEMAEPSDYDGCLVEFTATVAETRPRGDDGGDITLTGDGVSTLATLDRESFAGLPRLDAGTAVRIRGIVQIHLLGDDVAASGTMIPILRQMTVLPRSAADLEVLSIPSWWTPRRLATLLAGVAAVLAGALVWVGLLRREVDSQARMLAREMRLRRDAAIEFEASLRERNRLAANLHDTLLQTLGGIAYQLGACRARSQGGGTDAAEHLEVAGRMVDHATKELRGSVWALRTMPVVGHSFPDSLQTLLNQLSLGRSERLTLDVTGRPFHVPNFVAGNLLLVVQEAILNALHHGSCRGVATTVAFDESQAAIDLTIRDDGVGFRIGSQSGPEQGHFGLQGMRERIERLGGTITIDSEPSSGTDVGIRVRTRDYDAELDAETPAVQDA